MFSVLAMIFCLNYYLLVATKLYFTHHSYAVIILFKTGLGTGLGKSAFSTNSFEKLVFLRYPCFLSVMCFDFSFINFITYNHYLQQCQVVNDFPLILQETVQKQIYLYENLTIALKGYLLYKMVTSQNVASEVQFKNFSSFCIFDSPMIYQICGVMISISTRDRVHF